MTLKTMLQQYRDRHQKDPEEIVITPLAALVLALKEGVPSSYAGIPIHGRDFTDNEAALSGRKLGIFYREDEAALRSCDLI